MLFLIQPNHGLINLQHSYHCLSPYFFGGLVLRLKRLFRGFLFLADVNGVTAAILPTPKAFNFFWRFLVRRSSNFGDCTFSFDSILLNVSLLTDDFNFSLISSIGVSKSFINDANWPSNSLMRSPDALRRIPSVRF